MKYFVVVYGDKIYVIGGVSDIRGGFVFSLVECYIFEKNFWMSVFDMLVGRFDY